MCEYIKETIKTSCKQQDAEQNQLEMKIRPSWAHVEYYRGAQIKRLGCKFLDGIYIIHLGLLLTVIKGLLISGKDMVN